jgi:hypothetical protein
MNPYFVYYFSLIQLLYIQEQALRYVNKLFILEKSDITQGVIHVFGFYFLIFIIYLRNAARDPSTKYQLWL